MYGVELFHSSEAKSHKKGGLGGVRVYPSVLGHRQGNTMDRCPS